MATLTLQCGLDKLQNKQLSFAEGPELRGLIDQQMLALTTQIDDLQREGETNRKQIVDLTGQLDAANLVKQQILVIFPGQEDQLGARVQAAHDQLEQLAALQAVQDAVGGTTLEKVQAIIAQAGQVAGLQQQLLAANAVKQQILVIFPGPEDQLVDRIRAANGPQLDQINALPAVQGAVGGTTLEKIQAIIAIAGGVPALQGQVRDLQTRAAKLDGLARIEEVDPNGKTQAEIDDQALGNARRERAINDELVEILREAFPKRALRDYDQIDEAVADLRGRLQVVNRELSHVKGDHFDDKLVNHRRELVEEVTVSGTVMRIVNGVVNGLINTLYFAFVSLPKFCLGSLRFIGGIFVR